MTDLHSARSSMTPAEISALSEKEALDRLDLLATVSSLLDAALDDYDEAMDSVAEACVDVFADLCAIEVVAPDGTLRCVALRQSRAGGLRVPVGWRPVGRVVAPDR